MIETLPSDSPSILGFRISGRLHDEDYKTFIPTVEAALKVVQGKVSLLAKFEDFEGWDMHAAWDDMVFGVRHFADFERIAVVGDEEWQEWMARFAKPFTLAKVRHFKSADEAAAWVWLRDGD